MSSQFSWCESIYVFVNKFHPGLALENSNLFYILLISTQMRIIIKLIKSNNSVIRVSAIHVMRLLVTYKNISLTLFYPGIIVLQ